MIHTVHLDDKYMDVRKLLMDIRHYKRGVRFENPAVNAAPPKGYMTGEEFERRCIANISKFYREKGLL